MTDKVAFLEGLYHSLHPSEMGLGHRSWKPFSIKGDEKIAVDQFINLHVPPVYEFYPFDATREPFAIVAVGDQSGRMIGAAVVEAESPTGRLDRDYHLELNYIAVDPDYRGKGLAQHLIAKGMIFAILGVGKPPVAFNGICKEEQRGFYEKIGFNVTAPYDSLPEGVIPDGHEIAVDPNYPCSFWRLWTEEDTLWWKKLMKENS